MGLFVSSNLFYTGAKDHPDTISVFTKTGTARKFEVAHLRNLNNIVDYAPLVSSVTGLCRIIKSAIEFFKALSKCSKEDGWIAIKNLIRGMVAIIPLAGNLTLIVFDTIRDAIWARKVNKSLENQNEVAGIAFEGKVLDLIPSNELTFQGIIGPLDLCTVIVLKTVKRKLENKDQKTLREVFSAGFLSQAVKKQIAQKSNRELEAEISIHNTIFDKGMDFFAENLGPDKQLSVDAITTHRKMIQKAYSALQELKIDLKGYDTQLQKLDSVLINYLDLVSIKCIKEDIQAPKYPDTKSWGWDKKPSKDVLGYVVPSYSDLQSFVRTCFREFMEIHDPVELVMYFEPIYALDTEGEIDGGNSINSIRESLISVKMPSDFVVSEAVITTLKKEAKAKGYADAQFSKIRSNGTLLISLPFSRVDIQSFVIGSGCTEMLPCQHECTITYADGEQRRMTLEGNLLKKLLSKLPSSIVKNPSGQDHFAS